MVTSMRREDAVISEFLTTLGPWADHVVIGGGHALIIYKAYLAGQKKGVLPPATKDIDSLIPRRMPNVSPETILHRLDQAGFRAQQKSMDDIPVLCYVKEILGEKVEIEFLTDYEVRKTPETSFWSKYDNCHISGVVAQPLKYIKQSVNDFLPFQTFSGVSGKVVSPQAWIFHKGLTFPLRRDQDKVCKDLYGIWYVATQLGTFSTAALSNLENLIQRYPKRFKTFKTSLEKWISKATLDMWKQLERQDPTRTLKQMDFRNLMRTLTRIEPSASRPTP